MTEMPPLPTRFSPQLLQEQGGALLDRLDRTNAVGGKYRNDEEGCDGPCDANAGAEYLADDAEALAEQARNKPHRGGDNGVAEDRADPPDRQPEGGAKGGVATFQPVDGRADERGVEENDDEVFDEIEGEQPKVVVPEAGEARAAVHRVERAVRFRLPDQRAADGKRRRPRKERQRQQLAIGIENGDARLDKAPAAAEAADYVGHRAFLFRNACRPRGRDMPEHRSNSLKER